MLYLGLRIKIVVIYCHITSNTINLCFADWYIVSLGKHIRLSLEFIGWFRRCGVSLRGRQRCRAEVIPAVPAEGEGREDRGGGLRSKVCDHPRPLGGMRAGAREDLGGIHCDWVGLVVGAIQGLNWKEAEQILRVVGGDTEGSYGLRRRYVVTELAIGHLGGRLGNEGLTNRRDPVSNTWACGPCTRNIVLFENWGWGILIHNESSK